jgi:putative DNA primase/helicase
VIPPELVESEQWVVWRAEARDDRVTKVPYRPSAPRLRASVDDPASWGTYHQACRVPGVDGIGFVFTAEDPYTGIDLDDCISSSGKIHEAAAEIVRTLGGYLEPSPSGRGLHIVVRAELRGERHRTSDTPWGGVLEVYDRLRYFTISDRGVGAPADRQLELNRVVEELLPATGKEVNQSGARAAVALDDQELLDRMFASRRGADIRALYDGAGRDPSAGDLAL